MKRNPIVAGRFYPNTKKELESMIDALSPKKVANKITARAVISPHAGYVYSGAVAARLFSAIEIPKIAIVLGPNHTGLGKKVALMAKGEWLLPNGVAKIDEGLADKLITGCNLISDDETAHAQEHSIEVQIPFLLKYRPDIQIVPISISHIPIDKCREIGIAIAKTIEESDEEILIVASSDMNHYENQMMTEKKDSSAIEKILELDPEGLYDICAENDITMCGVTPTAVTLFAAIEMGNARAQLIEHRTSGAINKDFDSVVGYASIVIE